MNRRTFRPPVAAPVAAPGPPPPPPPPPAQKVTWGAPIWTLLHTMAEKITDADFAAVREDLLNVIFTICTNLPCPECSDHALKHMNTPKRYLRNIRSRAELRDYLWEYHNMVNQYKKYDLFGYDGLDQYKTMFFPMAAAAFVPPGQAMATGPCR